MSSIFLQCTIYMHAPATVLEATHLSEFILLSFILINLKVLEGVGVLGSGNDTIDKLVYDNSDVTHD